MSEGVTFDGEEQFNTSTPSAYGVPAASSGIVGWLIKMGVVKTAQAAKITLLVGTVFSIGLSIYLFSRSSTKNTLTPEQVRIMQNEHVSAPSP